MTSAEILDVQLAAVRALARAGQWDLAARLLDACESDDPQVPLARADLAVWRDFWQATSFAGQALATAQATRSTWPPEHRWRLDLLRLQRDYLAAVAPPDGTVRIGPDQHPAGLRADLADRAAHLHQTALEDTGRGWLAFWRGAIADNILGDHATAGTHFAAALAAGEATGDNGLVGEALRHLGAHAHRQGDHPEAGRLWRRAAELWQRAGAVPQVLSQLLVLARHAADTGEQCRAAAVAGEVHKWAATLRLNRLAAQAAGFRP